VHNIFSLRKLRRRNTYNFATSNLRHYLLTYLNNNLQPISINTKFAINNSDIANRIHMDIDTGLKTTVYHLPYPRLDYTKRQITYSGVKLWNSLPHNLKKCTSTKHFKKIYHKLLLT